MLWTKLLFVSVSLRNSYRNSFAFDQSMFSDILKGAALLYFAIGHSHHTKTLLPSYVCLESDFISKKRYYFVRKY